MSSQAYLGCSIGRGNSKRDVILEQLKLKVGHSIDASVTVCDSSAIVAR